MAYYNFVGETTQSNLEKPCYPKQIRASAKFRNFHPVKIYNKNDFDTQINLLQKTKIHGRYC